MIGQAAITTARGFMEFYERYAPSKGLLDSAIVYLGRQSDIEAAKKTKQGLHTGVLPCSRIFRK